MSLDYLNIHLVKDISIAILVSSYIQTNMLKSSNGETSSTRILKALCITSFHEMIGAKILI